jgi:hypothetical protein
VEPDIEDVVARLYAEPGGRVAGVS